MSAGEGLGKRNVKDGKEMSDETGTAAPASGSPSRKRSGNRDENLALWPARAWRPMTAID